MIGNLVGLLGSFQNARPLLQPIDFLREGEEAKNLSKMFGKQTDWF